MPSRHPAQPEGALYVRLPSREVDKLDRASHALGIHKKDLVAGLVARYVDPDSPAGLTALGALASSPSGPRPPSTNDPGDGRPTLGAYSFRPHDPPEVLTAAQAAELLQLTEQEVNDLADAGTIPGRNLGGAWRFARAALLAWLGAPSPR